MAAIPLQDWEMTPEMTETSEGCCGDQLVRTDESDMDFPRRTFGVIVEEHSRDDSSTSRLDLGVTHHHHVATWIN